MSGYFKLVDAHDHGYRLKLMSGDGELVAVSAYFPTKQAAVEGIDLIREIAGTRPVVDHSRNGVIVHEAAKVPEKDRTGRLSA